jgi:hypothetical protein
MLAEHQKCRPQTKQLRVTINSNIYIKVVRMEWMLQDLNWKSQILFSKTEYQTVISNIATQTLH